MVSALNECAATTSPNSPATMDRLRLAKYGIQRMLWLTINNRLARSAAAIMLRASSLLSASGFSTRT
jgi:hypothetical protein